MAIHTPFQWRQASWDEGCEQVKQFTDRLGKTVDGGIFDAVVALNLLGLRTFQSCEGHLDHGCPYPWITLEDREQSGRFVRAWQPVCDLQDEAERAKTIAAYDVYLMTCAAFDIQVAQWKREDTLFQRTVKLLDHFYADRGPSPTRLMVQRLHPGLCRIETVGSRKIREMPDDFKATYLGRTRAEMADFTVFLKQQYLEDRGEWKQGAQKPPAMNMLRRLVRKTRREWHPGSLKKVMSGQDTARDTGS